MPRGVLIIDCADTDKVSDGAHTFADLYVQRSLLFSALCRVHGDKAWRSHRHSDGSARDNYFIAGLELPTGKHVTFHMTDDFWACLHNVRTLDKAPAWDGHEPKDVCDRLEDWLYAEVKL